MQRLHRPNVMARMAPCPSGTPARPGPTAARPALMLALVLVSAGCGAWREDRAQAPVAPSSPTATGLEAQENRSTRPARPPSPTPATPERSATPPAPDLAALEIELQTIAEGFEQPLLVLAPADGSNRLFVVEKAGRVISFDRDAPAGDRRLELDLRDRIESSGFEQGLLGLAFHPDYAENGRLFVDYTDRDGDTRVAELRRAADGSSIDPRSERLLLRIEQPARNHNGGHLAFGPDGRLYIGSGDGGGADDRYGQGQNPEGRAAKILRLDVDALPPASPSETEVEAGAGRLEIVAWGLRNPWRFSFDRATGDLYIGDVGQASWEEIDRIAAAELGRPINFGWPVFEGRACFGEAEDCQGPAAEGMRPPILVHGHEAGDCSITGGFVHRGSTPGSALHGAYLYADYCSGRIRAARPDGAGGWIDRELLDTDLAIASFGEDERGEVYVCDLQDGSIYRIAPLTGSAATDGAAARPSPPDSPRPGL